MGCDIHLYVEKNENGKWVTADRWGKNEYAEDGGDQFVVDDSFYDGRNYNLFAILADVRNGRGFAEIKTGEGFVPIATPKGLPDDCSKEVRTASESWGCDGHSHSYLTVAELMDYDWTQVSCLQGWVDAVNFESYERYRKSRQEGPEEYSGMVNGPHIKHVSNQIMRDAIKGKTDGLYGKQYISAIERAAPGWYTLLEWEIPYYKCAKEFLSETMPRLWRLGNPGEVRIVFWFDN